MTTKKIFFLISCIFSVLLAKTQQYAIDDLNQSVFLYPDFYKGKVLFKNKATQQALFNYNTLFQQMICVQNGSMMALDNTAAIDTVYIDTLTFVPVDTFFCEVRLAHSAMPLFIKYETEITKAAPATPFGGTSQTGAVQNVSSYRWSVATPYQLKVPDGYKLIKSAGYYLRSENQFVQLKGSKQIKQLYPVYEKQLNHFIHENHIGFDRTADMEKLVSFIGTLNK